jgi:hypothetical protein
MGQGYLLPKKMIRIAHASVVAFSELVLKAFETRELTALCKEVGEQSEKYDCPPQFGIKNSGCTGIHGCAISIFHSVSLAGANVTKIDNR